MVRTSNSIVVAGLLAAAHCLAQSGTPVPATFFGMSAMGGDYPRVTIGTLAHSDFAWQSVGHTKGTFDFGPFDSILADAQLHGLVDPVTNTANMAITLAAGTPGWAVADPGSCRTTGPDAPVCTAPPDNIQDWKDFLTALVQHYNGKTQPHIRYYELWNEFNVALWWTGTDTQMLALAVAAYPIIHQDPYSMLLTPSVAGDQVFSALPTTPSFHMTQYLQAGGSKYADGGAFHGYMSDPAAAVFPMPEQDSTPNCKSTPACHASIVTMATQMRSVFDQNGMAGKPIFQTEGSWGNMSVTDPDTQVAWLARYMLLQAGLRTPLNLQLAAWFTWGAGGTFGWGDVETTSYDPNPAGIAYNQVFNWVVGANNQPCSSAADGTWICSLTRPNGYSALAFWNVNGTASYKPAAGYTQYRDLAGNTTPIPFGATVPIGAKPILVEGAAATAPVITQAANAEGDTPLIAPNTWVEIKGLNLAPAGDSQIWQDSDFVNHQMPVRVGGVSATVNGKSAYVYYVSPTQVNILTPPDAMQGPVQVQLINNGAASSPLTAQAQPVSPSFFIFNGGPYVAGEHANGSLLGPANLFPGATTPAKPGEIVVLYANGFGPVSSSITSGSVTQSGILSPLPVIKIGGVAAAVQFAGLVAPGEFQFNVVVPASLKDGDQEITATQDGLITQPGVFLTVQH